ncbi:MAG: SAM-dependent methyltransferase [Gammaproteobacteria bacterium]|nr:SAM-dependent methyltransferase [Gammaproteobacteria bacterium]
MDEDGLRHSRRVVELIKARIEAAGGTISFADYMNLALYAPGLGYYSAGAAKFGAAGDFVTAPEISALFSQCLARQCMQVLRALDGGGVLEFGAGTGAMACDLLRELEAQQCLPDYYCIIELSAELRARQRAQFERRAPHLLGLVTWIDELPESGMKGVILANEVLDAMAVHRLRWHESGVCEMGVAWRDDCLCWHEMKLENPHCIEAVNALESVLPQRLPNGYETEINLGMIAWLQSVSDVLQEGAALIIDYGFPRQEYYHPQRNDGTLRCHYRHRAHADPFLYPGLQDITAHVDMTAVAEAAHQAGLTVAGYTSQAYFLLANGLMEIADSIGATATRQQVDIARQIKTLTLPGEMGELFKVMALTRGIDEPLAGFAMRDERFRL